MVIQEKNLYKEIIGITQDYLGPASERFIYRQIKNHLHKTPEELDQADIKVLIKWSKIAMALLTNNNEVVDEFASRLKALAKTI